MQDFKKLLNPFTEEEAFGPEDLLMQSSNPILNEQEKQKALTTNIQDYTGKAIEKEVSNANKIADESIDLGSKYAEEENQAFKEMDETPSNEMQNKADELAYKKDVYSKFMQATPKQQAEIQDDLKSLQEEARRKSSNLDWFRLGDKIAQAYGQRHGGKVAGFQDIYDSLEKQAQQPVLDYKQLQKNQSDKLNQLMESYKSKSLSEKIDPSSPYARVQKSLLDSAAKKGGFDLGNTEGLSAEALNELNRMINYYNTNKEEIAARKAGLEIARQDKADAKKEKQNIDKEKGIEKDVQKLELETRSPQTMLDAFSEVETLLGGPIDEFTFNKSGDLIKSGKKLDLPGVSLPGLGRVSIYSGDARDLAATAKKIFNVTLKDRSGATVTNTELENLKQEFSEGKFNTEPELVKGLQRYKRAVNKELNKRAAAFRPEVLDTYKERSGLDFKKTDLNKELSTEDKKLSDEDKQAMEWAQKNPNDPRSKKILQKLGM